MKKILSFGGGVQSTALAILIAQGKIECDAIVFCDTGFEQSIVFDFLNKHTLKILEEAKIPFFIAKAEDYSGMLNGESTFSNFLLPPFFNKSEEKINYTKIKKWLCNCKNTELYQLDNYEFTHDDNCEFELESDDDFQKRVSFLPAQEETIGRLPAYCSSKWKADTFKRFLAKHLKDKNYEVIMGFSTDEMHRAGRMKSTKKYQYKFPLLDLRMNRGDCMELVEHTFNAPPPRSSCYFCPNHTQHEWREVMQSADREKVISIDAKIRDSLKDKMKGGIKAFLTVECKPIAECDFDDRNEVIFSRFCSGGCFL